jgi:hypothetical protein
MSESIVQEIENIFEMTEADVVAVIVDIKTGVEVAAEKVNAALKWVAANAPSIVADIQQVETIVETVGLASQPDVAAAIVAANASVAALNAFAAAENSGQSNTAALLSGYVAVKQSQAAAASAAAVAVSTSVPPPPSA